MELKTMETKELKELKKEINGELRNRQLEINKEKIAKLEEKNAKLQAPQ